MSTRRRRNHEETTLLEDKGIHYIEDSEDSYSDDGEQISKGLHTMYVFSCIYDCCVMSYDP